MRNRVTAQQAREARKARRHELVAQVGDDIVAQVRHLAKGPVRLDALRVGATFNIPTSFDGLPGWKGRVVRLGLGSVQVRFLEGTATFAGDDTIALSGGTMVQEVES